MGQELTAASWAATPFNTPYEVGFRSLVVLAEIFADAADLQRLIFYDYLMVHSGDISEGPQSLHPATPFRAQEYAVRRDILSNGLLLMASRNLAQIRVTSAGIEYSATELTVPFLDRLTTRYVKVLAERAEWVHEVFGRMSHSAFIFMRDFSDELSTLASGPD
jgi:hypothetical protein